jgi:hypothetical protein
MFGPRGALPAMREGHGTSCLVAFLEDAASAERCPVSL